MLVEQSVVCPVLVGRDAPLSTVLRTLDRARAAHGSTLLVSGEAGIGKSRLVRAMIERARSLGFVTLQGACFEADRAHPYAPVVDLVRVTSATASPALTAHYFAPAAGELVTLFPELRSIFPDAAPRQAHDPEEDRRRLFHSFAEAVHALAHVRPLAMVVEDVHWSDDATLDLLLHLARRIGSQPIALILTFRSDEAIVQGDPHATSLFTVRLRFPDGYTIAPHTHPTDEHVTVISGTLRVGMGSKADLKQMMTMPAGGFVTAPANHPHFAAAKGVTIVQVHAMGPFAMTYVDPADLPKAASNR